MAADERRIVIELQATTKTSSSSSVNGGEGGEKKVENFTKQELKRSVHELTTQINYSIDKYLTLSEDYKNAIRFENINTAVHKVQSISNAIESGFLLGKTLGFGGAFVGVATNSLIWLIRETAQLQRMYTDQGLSLAMGDKTSGYARSRLGLIDNGRGTYN